MPAAKGPIAPPPPTRGKTATEIVANQPSATTQPPVNVKHVASALLGLWIILQGLVWLVAGKSYRLDPLTTEEANEDAVIVWPLVEKHPTIGRLLSFVGAPIAVVRRVAQKLRRKPDDGNAKAGKSDPRSDPGSGALPS